MSIPRVGLLAGTVLAVLAGGCAGDDRTRTEPLRPNVQPLLEEIRKAGAPGVVALVRNQSGTRRFAAGSAVLEPRRPMRPRDRVRVGSLTKTFVATVVLQLASEGRLSLDDTVERRYPGLLRYGRRITIRQLLNHTSGFPRSDDHPDSEPMYHRYLADFELDMPVRRRVAMADELPLLFAPDTGQRYTNTGYDVLGLIVEHVTRRPLARELEERIFEPLDLRHTSFEAKPLRAQDVAHGYAIAGSDVVRASWDGPQDATRASLLGTWASAAIVSTADDLAAFYGALLSGKLLPPTQVDQMLTTVPTDSPEERAGLGIFRERVACGYAWGHGGATLGYSARALASRDGSHVVVVAANAYSSDFSRAFVEAARTTYCRSRITDS